MKLVKQLSLIGLAIMLVLTSCTMDKRLYVHGYHISWNKSNRNIDNQEASSKNVKQKEKSQTKTLEQSGNTIDTIDNKRAINEDDITASVNNQQIVLYQKQKNILLSNYKVKTTAEEKQKESTLKSALKKRSKTAITNEDEPKINAMALAGFICSLVGLILFLLTAWPFLLGTLGVIFSIIGLRKIRKDPSKWKGKGFAIAGLILGILDILLFWALIILIVILFSMF